LIDSYGYKLFVNITTYVRKHKCCYIGSPYEIPPHGASLLFIIFSKYVKMMTERRTN